MTDTSKAHKLAREIRSCVEKLNGLCEKAGKEGVHAKLLIACDRSIPLSESDHYVKISLHTVIDVSVEDLHHMKVTSL